MRGLEVENTTLISGNGEPKAKRLGTTRVIPVDTVIFCIGDRVDEEFGLPVRWNEFVKNPSPRFPVNNASYEAYDPDKEKPIEGVFVAGWSREASSGLVGVARKDGENGAQAVLRYLQTLPPLRESEQILERLDRRLKLLDKPIVSKKNVECLIEIERAEAMYRGLEDFKFATNPEMLAAMGLG